MALRSPTQTHSYWGSYASGSLPTSSNVQVGDTAFDTTLGSLVVCTAIGPVVWTAVGGSTPASPTTSIQFNNAGAFGGSADLTYDATTQTVLLQDASVPGARQFIELATGLAIGIGPSIAIAEEDTALGNVASLTLSTDNMLGGGSAVIRSEEPSTFPAPLDLQIRELQINGAPGSVGEVLVSQGTGAAPTWTPSAGLYVAQNIVLDAAATSGAATIIGSVYFPAAVTLNAASTLAYFGGSLVTDTSVLTIVPAGGGAAQVTFTRAGTIGSQAYTAGGAILAAGWYDLILQGTVGSGVAFARGLYLY